MEHITRQQTILIALLVAIVTSIATAISVVSLTDPAGSPTQTIYRVIEKTIEKVADIPKTTTIPARVTDTPKVSAVLSPSDIAERGASSLVRIYDKSSGEKKFVALGVVVGDKDGVIASALAIENTTASSYVAVTPDGGDVPATYVKGNVDRKSVV